MLRSTLIAAATLALLVSCGSSSPTDADHAAAVESWRADRLARLKAPDGFLNLAGLYWLRDGISEFGSAADNDVVFPGGPVRIGRFELSDSGVTMQVEDGIDVRVDGEPVSRYLLNDDTSDAPDTATLGSLSWTVIQRDGRFAVRLRDLENPALESLPPIPQYEIDPAWRVEAALRPYTTPRVAAVNTVIEGLGWNPESPGIVEFDVDGERYGLEAYAVGERLFFVFADLTSGRETYPAGRFLYADAPDAAGTTVLDFNLAYNPPCAFNDFSTCPVASPRNRLPVAVTAGEKFDDALYMGSTQ